jgi:acetyltransferase
MFANMWRYSDQLRALYETPLFADDAVPPREQIAAALQAARRAGQTLLDGAVVKRILAAYGLPAGPPAETRSNDAARAYEFLLSSSIDDTFGPVLVFGVGGHVADVIADRACGLPPLTTTLARRMLEQTQIVPALMGMGDPPLVNILALEQTLVRFSRLVIEQPSIKEISVNPLLATAQGVTVRDAQIVLHAGNVDEQACSKPAIRPYPTQYIFPWSLKDGTPVTIRPIRPDDEPLMVRFHGTLSPHSVQMRYFAPLTLSRRIDHERLVRMCCIDYDREMALVMVRTDPQTGDQALLAVGRLATLPGTDTAEFALLMSDQYQGHGIGTELLRHLVDVGRDEQLHQITAQILPENRAMQHVAEKVGFRLRRVFREQVVVAELDL